MRQNFACKVDANQPGIVAALKKIPGVGVRVSNIGDGFPDLIVFSQGDIYLIEIKDGDKIPSKRKLTPDQQQFVNDWPGPVYLAESLDDVLRIIGIKKSGDKPRPIPRR